MAAEFSSRDARELIQLHKKLLKELNEVSGISTAFGQEVRQAAQRLGMSGALSNIVHRDLTQTDRGNLRSPDTDRLICALFRYRSALSFAQSARKLLGAYKDPIQSGILAVQIRTGGLQWLLSGAKTKAKAIAAYTALTELRDGDYGEAVRGLSGAIDGLQKSATAQAWEAVLSEPADYRQLLDQLVPGQMQPSAGNRACETLLQEQRELENRISEGLAGGDGDREAICAAARKLAGVEALKILQGVPVEELNREHSGIRVKTLRESGFATIADIHGASEYQLAAVHGISEEAASTVKEIAREFADRAAERVRIRLSADNRSREATGLITAIYAHRLHDAKREELRELSGSRKRDISRNADTLRHAGSSLDWLFLSEEARTHIRQAYRELNGLLTGDYARQADLLLAILGSKAPRDAGTAWRDFEQNSIAYYTLLEEVVPGILGNDDSLYGLPEELAREIQEEGFFPDGLLCTLRRYQEWGVKYILHQERVLLGDEMGLGKTVQAIAAMVSLRNTGATHFVVVCPASVVANWCREIAKHSKLRVTKVHGADRAAALNAWMQTGGVAVTTYETTGFFKLPEDFEFQMLIVDEAHYIKNPEARRTGNVKRLCGHTQRLLFMTGTALENKVDEMIALIGILQPQIASALHSMAFMSTAPQFREQVAPVYYRRKREDVLTELPELIESREWCTMSPQEESVYEQAVLARNYPAARRVSWNVEDLTHSSKAARLTELLEAAEEEQRKVIIFSFFLGTMDAVRSLLGNKCYGPINGSVSPQRRQEIIDEFDKAPPGSVLLAQIQSGGTGLNIQSASVVVICEPQLKPSIENQAISRAYRMGQSRNVLVYRLLCEDTVDERVTELLEQKQAIFDAFADKSVAAEQSMELDTATFGQIIQEEIDRINAKREHTAGSEQT